MQQQILLIDDLKSIHPLVSALLADEPVTIHSAFDGQQGLVLAGSSRPDLILLDVEMPIMDGYETCRRLKANEATAHIPIIFLTARSATDEIVNGLDLGANDYVGKPFKLPELLSRVRAALRTGHLIRLLEDKALIDALTGLGNRAMFQKRLAADIALRIRSGSPLSCIAIDMDRFKEIDRSGRAFSDRALTKVGDALTEICRVEDVPCRIGGQEFAVLLPQTGADVAAQLAEKMRKAIAEIALTRENICLFMTASFGVAQAKDLYDRSILERAQEALAYSKAQGRNRVTTAQPTPAAASKVA